MAPLMPTGRRFLRSLAAVGAAFAAPPLRAATVGRDTLGAPKWLAAARTV